MLVVLLQDRTEDVEVNQQSKPTMPERVIACPLFDSFIAPASDPNFQLLVVVEALVSK